MSKKLSKEVAEKYNLVGIEPSKIVHGFFGTLDFRTMGISEADALFKSGLQYLKLKPPVVKKSKKDLP